MRFPKDGMKAINEDENYKENYAAEAAKAFLEMHKIHSHLIDSHERVFTNSVGNQTCLDTQGFSAFVLVARNESVPHYPATSDYKGVTTKSRRATFLLQLDVLASETLLGGCRERSGPSQETFRWNG